jgi:hypothetical protein
MAPAPAVPTAQAAGAPTVAASSPVATAPTVVSAPTVAATSSPAVAPSGAAPTVQFDNSSVTVLAFNDLGMHCMNKDFSEFMILPPYNTLHAQVIDRRNRQPRILTQGITVSYSVPGNTHSSDKTNFWKYAQALLGMNLAPDTGLTGNKLSGQMAPGTADWVATGIPLTQIDDQGNSNPYQLAKVVVTDNSGKVLGQSGAVVPVSWELNCDLCHNGKDAAKSVLQSHDKLHNTKLYNPSNQTPVACGQCHAQPELGLAGTPPVKTLSASIHTAHAARVASLGTQVPDNNVCYACHPGVQTKCQRDVHLTKGVTCGNCHAPNAAGPQQMMETVGNPARKPWTDEPACTNCHNVAGHQYEQANTLFRNSQGHAGLYCEACHNSTHAITPAVDAADNAQSVAIQGTAGPINKCTACHQTQPNEQFPHRFFTGD